MKYLPIEAVATPPAPAPLPPADPVAGLLQTAAIYREAGHLVLADQVVEQAFGEAMVLHAFPMTVQ